jgi:dephospho-CoA kinase
MFRDMGIPVHDADAQVHKLLAAGGSGVALVGKVFPSALKKTEAGENFIDRGALGRIVLGDLAALKKLEDVLHPLVRATSDAFVEQHRKAGAELVVLDIPLLYETGAEMRVDTVVCVSAPREVQRARVLERPGMTPEKFDRILARQMPDEEKVKRADYIVRTDRGFEDMRRQLEAIADDLRERD